MWPITSVAGNETSDFVKFGDVLDLVSYYQHLKSNSVPQN
jgi:hypothetical protein